MLMALRHIKPEILRSVALRAFGDIQMKEAEPCCFHFYMVFIFSGPAFSKLWLTHGIVMYLQCSVLYSVNKMFLFLLVNYQLKKVHLNLTYCNMKELASEQTVFYSVGHTVIQTSTPEPRHKRSHDELPRRCDPMKVRAGACVS